MICPSLVEMTTDDGSDHDNKELGLTWEEMVVAYFKH
jgi:hypothetical protein